MAYTPNTWVNDDPGTAPGASGGALNDDRLNHMETGISGAHTTADAAVPKAVVDAAGDLVVGSANDAVTRLAQGATGTWLKSTAGGLAWSTIAAADIQDITTRVDVRKDSAGSVFSRRRLNLIQGANVTLTVADDAGSEEVDITIAAASASATVYRKTTEKDVANTVTETDLLNAEITIAAGVMSTNKTARATLGGDILSNAAGTLTLRIKFGGTTLWGDAFAMTNSATRMPWWLTFNIANLGATNSQWMNGVFTADSPGAAGSVAGLGDIDVTNAVQSAWPISATADPAIDTTGAQALVVTAQWGAASASSSCRLKQAVVEVV